VRNRLRKVNLYNRSRPGNRMFDPIERSLVQQITSKVESL
jgi:hypothetical protein